MIPQTYRDPNGNYTTYKIVLPPFRIAANVDDFTPTPTATLAPEDPGNGTLQITDLTLLQVIKNVDLVKGKRTLARTTLDFNEGTDNITRQATAKAYLGGQFQAEGTLTLTGGLNNLDVFFTPNPAMAANNQSFNLTEF